MGGADTPDEKLPLQARARADLVGRDKAERETAHAGGNNTPSCYEEDAPTT